MARLQKRVRSFADPETAPPGPDFDLVVVGGGIHGACATWDASVRGLKVLLLEKGDFGEGASANSLKIVHGGLRYLQNLDLRRFRQSVRERSFWFRAAPHHVDPLAVVFPTYGWGVRSRPVVRTGLLLNDLLSAGRNRGLEPGRGIPGGRSLATADVVRRVPELEGDPPDGGVLFHDGIYRFPERLVLDVVRTAREAGAVTLNHTEVVEGGRLSDGRLRVVAEDRLTGTRTTFAARAVLNAAGAQGDHVAAHFVPGGSRSGRSWSSAVNIVVDHLGHQDAFALPARGEGGGGRQLFVVPWRGRTMIGTGHFNLTGPAPVDPGERAGLAELDLGRFLEEVNRSWPGGPRFRRDDVRLVHWGMLPRLAGPVNGPVRLLSRHDVVDHAGEDTRGFFTLRGVKFTTARKAAQEAVDAVCGYLGLGEAGTTSRRGIAGAPAAGLKHLEAEAQRRGSDHMPAGLISQLTREYGSHALEILDLVEREPELAEPLVPGEKVVLAQLVYGVRVERARTVDDLLLRRTPMGSRGSVRDSAARRAARVLEAEGGARETV